MFIKTIKTSALKNDTVCDIGILKKDLKTWFINVKKFAHTCIRFTNLS